MGRTDYSCKYLFNWKKIVKAAFFVVCSDVISKYF